MCKWSETSGTSPSSAELAESETADLDLERSGPQRAWADRSRAAVPVGAAAEERHWAPRSSPRACVAFMALLRRSVVPPALQHPRHRAAAGGTARAGGRLAGGARPPGREHRPAAARRRGVGGPGRERGPDRVGPVDRHDPVAARTHRAGRAPADRRRHGPVPTAGAPAPAARASWPGAVDEPGTPMESEPIERGDEHRDAWAAKELAASGGDRREPQAASSAVAGGEQLAAQASGAGPS